jgi:hypothetical protein
MLLHQSRLPGVAYTVESFVQPSRPANALTGAIPQKADGGGIKYWLAGPETPEIYFNRKKYK